MTDQLTPDAQATWVEMQRQGYTCDLLIGGWWWCGRGASGSLGRTWADAINKEIKSLPGSFFRMEDKK